jgi:hypothetical protein
MRQAEVNSAYLLYEFASAGGAIFTQPQIDAVQAALLNNTIIVRPGIHAQSIVAPPPGP